MSVAVLNAMNTRGRAAICGAISHYNEVILMIIVMLMMMLMIMLMMMLMIVMVMMIQKLMKGNGCTHNSQYIICCSVLEIFHFNFII